MRSRQFLPLLALIWACFLARGLFYCSFLPLWEGYDEWAHFSYMERLVTAGDVLVGREVPVSQEVEASLQLAPLPWGCAACRSHLSRKTTIGGCPPKNGLSYSASLRQFLQAGPVSRPFMAANLRSIAAAALLLAPFFALQIGKTHIPRGKSVFLALCQYGDRLICRSIGFPGDLACVGNSAMLYAPRPY